MGGEGLRVAGRVTLRSLGFVEWENLLCRDGAFRRLGGGEPAHLPRSTGIDSLSSRLAAEYLHWLSTQTEDRDT